MLRSGNASDTPFTRLRGLVRRLLHPARRYDLVLAVMPTVILLGVGLGTLTDVPLRAALAGASFFDLLVLVDTLFVHPPTRDGGRGPV